MSVYKPKNTPFYHFDFQISGHRFHGSTGERRERAAALVEAEEKRKARKLVDNPDHPVDITLNAAAGELWASKAKHQPSADTQKYEISEVLRIYGKDTLISEIDDGAIARGVATRRGEPSRLYKPKNHDKDFKVPLVSPATVNRETKMLRRIIKRAARVLRAKQPVEHLRPDWSMHMLAEPDPPDRPLTYDQERRLFEELVGHIKPIVDVAILTGLRKSEILGLDCKNIDFKEMKGGTWRKSRKHGQEWFSFYITEPLLAVMAPHVAGRTEGPVWRYGPHCSCRLCSLNKNHGRQIKEVRVGFKAACARAGIPDFRFHDLRHTFGSRTVQIRGDLVLAKDGLGHKSITTTMRYAHHAPNAQADLQRELANLRPPRDGASQKSRKNPEADNLKAKKYNKINKKAG